MNVGSILVLGFGATAVTLILLGLVAFVRDELAGGSDDACDLPCARPAGRGSRPDLRPARPRLRDTVHDEHEESQCGGK